MLGLILSGGSSTRMGQDKGAMIYSPSKLTQRERCYELLKPFCDEVYISCREEQRPQITPNLPIIIDAINGEGPGVGLLSAHALHPEESLFVLACDFPYVTGEDISYLVAAHVPEENDATYYEIEKGVIEPLLAIWEVKALEKLRDNFKLKKFSPKKTLYAVKALAVTPLEASRLVNVNEKKSSGHLS